MSSAMYFTNSSSTLYVYLRSLLEEMQNVLEQLLNIEQGSYLGKCILEARPMHMEEFVAYSPVGFCPDYVLKSLQPQAREPLSSRYAPSAEQLKKFVP